MAAALLLPVILALFPALSGENGRLPEFYTLIARFSSIFFAGITLLAGRPMAKHTTVTGLSVSQVLQGRKNTGKTIPR